VEPAGEAWALDAATRAPLQRAMTRGAGVLRSADSLAEAAAGLTALGGMRAPARTVTWEAANLLTVASALVSAATLRTETRGCHWREDHPDADAVWLGHLLATLDRAGRIDEAYQVTR
jgi:L-aspartate oxidase